MYRMKIWDKHCRESEQFTVGRDRELDVLAQFDVRASAAQTNCWRRRADFGH
jgi:hypothetical protein